ncbi:MAG: thermonuclease family protein [Erythrobacter sp.]
MVLGGQRVRLFGIDAPELDQSCFADGEPVACGKQAKIVLEGLIGDAPVSCAGQSTDVFGRIVAICRVSGVDLGEAMVAAGWATAFQKYSKNYLPIELRARARKAGMWQWAFQPPEDFRAAQSPRGTANPGAGSRPATTRTQEAIGKQSTCRIKGNQNRRGEWIYHLPGMPYYNVTRAEAYFCTEQDAQAVGYRRAIVK